MSLLLALLGGGGVNAPGAAVSYVYSISGGAAAAEQSSQNTGGWRGWEPIERKRRVVTHDDAPDQNDRAKADQAKPDETVSREIDAARVALGLAVADADKARAALARSKARAQSAARARSQARIDAASQKVDAIKIEIAKLTEIAREAAAREAIFEADMAFVAAIMMEI